MCASVMIGFYRCLPNDGGRVSMKWECAECMEPEFYWWKHRRWRQERLLQLAHKRNLVGHDGRIKWGQLACSQDGWHKGRGSRQNEKVRWDTPQQHNTSIQTRMYIGNMGNNCLHSLAILIWSEGLLYQTPRSCYPHNHSPTASFTTSKFLICLVVSFQTSFHSVYRQSVISLYMWRLPVARSAAYEDRLATHWFMRAQKIGLSFVIYKWHLESPTLDLILGPKTMSSEI